MADNKEKEVKAPPSKEELEYLKSKEISMDEIAKHNKEESPWSSLLALFSTPIMVENN